MGIDFGICPSFFVIHVDIVTLMPVFSRVLHLQRTVFFPLCNWFLQLFQVSAVFCFVFEPLELFLCNRVLRGGLLCLRVLRGFHGRRQHRRRRMCFNLVTGLVA